jgi:hypothetical protein
LLREEGVTRQILHEPVCRQPGFRRTGLVFPRTQLLTSFRRGKFRIASLTNNDGLGLMGTKYLPTVKDLKANQRFQQKQKPLPDFKKSAANQPAKKSKKK